LFWVCLSIYFNNFFFLKVIAVHSQNDTIPDCPDQWVNLWEGYSFVMTRAERAEGSGQSLLSPGSCLKQFDTVPYIECQPNGNCNKYATLLSFWLVKIDSNQEFGPVQVSTLKAGNNIRNSISRCRVCAGYVHKPPKRSYAGFNRFNNL
jgi:collagen type IV alpha